MQLWFLGIWNGHFSHFSKSNYGCKIKFLHIYNKLNNNEGVIICLYVDDLLIFGTSHNVVHDIKCFLASKFDMKILVKANVILGIKILRDNDCIVLSQSHYGEKKKIWTLRYVTYVYYVWLKGALGQILYW